MNIKLFVALGLILAIFTSYESTMASDTTERKDQRTMLVKSLRTMQPAELNKKLLEECATPEGENRTQFVVELLQSRADVNTTQEEGQSALMLAIESGNVPAAITLADQGADFRTGTREDAIILANTNDQHNLALMLSSILKHKTAAQTALEDCARQKVKNHNDQLKNATLGGVTVAGIGILAKLGIKFFTKK